MAVDKGAAAVVEVKVATEEDGGRSKKEAGAAGAGRNDLIQCTGGCGGGGGGKTHVGGTTDGCFSEEARAGAGVGDLSTNPGGGATFFSVVIIYRLKKRGRKEELSVSHSHSHSNPSSPLSISRRCWSLLPISAGSFSAVRGRK